MKQIGFLIIAAWLVLGCRTADLVWSIVVTPTATATNTRRPTFTSTPEPTATETATATSTPRSSATSTRRPVTPTVTVKPATTKALVATAVPGFARLPVHKIALKPGMDIAQATPVKGLTYCQITHYEFVADDPANKDSYLNAQGKRNAYFRVVNTDWSIKLDRPVTISWGSGSADLQWGWNLSDTWLRDRAQHPSLNYTWLGSNPGDYNSDYFMDHNSYGSYSAKVGGEGVVSDIAKGFGVDENGKAGAVVIQWVCSVY